MNDNRCEGWEYNQELCRQLAELQKAGEILKSVSEEKYYSHVKHHNV